jgi:hypothetical protein
MYLLVSCEIDKFIPKQVPSFFLIQKKIFSDQSSASPAAAVAATKTDWGNIINTDDVRRILEQRFRFFRSSSNKNLFFSQIAIDKNRYKLINIYLFLRSLPC